MAIRAPSELIKLLICYNFVTSGQPKSYFSMDGFHKNQSLDNLKLRGTLSDPLLKQITTAANIH